MYDEEIIKQTAEVNQSENLDETVRVIKTYWRTSLQSTSKLTTETTITMTKNLRQRLFVFF